ncbi:MAG: conserved phage C-terminal domain-containing protein [Cloacibacterium sp.]|nr:conserved phage C-terminal domain-containing protein [Cloacibacterium sp.]
MKTEALTLELEILAYLNDLASKRFKLIKSNLKPISARLKDGYTEQELREIIQVKTLEWKNNEVMNVHLCPTTLFRPSNVEKYLNQIIAIKENPQKYKQYYEQLNQKRTAPTDHTSGLNKINAMFGKSSG